MGAAEAPKSEQIQANVAAALSRLRGELGASSSPVAGTVQKAVPKSPTEPAEPNLAPLPAGPVRVGQPERADNVIRPFEPAVAATDPAPAPAPMPTPTPAPGVAAAPDIEPAPKPELVAEPVGIPGLFARREPILGATPTDRGSTPLTIDHEPQPDLLSGVEVPIAPPPPLGALESEDEDSGRGRRMRNRLLVLVLLLAIVGGGAYVYLKSQHATGPVPVITADTSPEKVKPADEGGLQVPNQNVQILDTMNNSQANDQAQVLPAPEQPVAPPAANDAATAEAPAATPAPANDNAPVVTDQPVPTVPAPPVPSASTPAPAVADVTQPQEAQPQATTAEPQQPTAQASKPAETQQAAPAATPAPAKTAEAPQATEAPKPAEPVAEAPAPAKTQTAAAPAAAPAVQPAPGGKARIQLAAVKSEALAKAQWEKFQKAHSELLGALTLNIQKVTVNGADYYRIQAGPLSDKSAARDLCAKLKAQKQDCLVAK